MERATSAGKGILIEGLTKRYGKGDTAVNIIGVAVSAVIVAASIYAQYALTKWAVKSALKETRPHD